MPWYISDYRNEGGNKDVLFAEQYREELSRLMSVVTDKDFGDHDSTNWIIRTSWHTIGLLGAITK